MAKSESDGEGKRGRATAGTAKPAAPGAKAGAKKLAAASIAAARSVAAGRRAAAEGAGAKRASASKSASAKGSAPTKGSATTKGSASTKSAASAKGAGPARAKDPPVAPKDPPKASRRVEFTAVLEGNDAGAAWAAVLLPAKVHAALGGDKGRIPVAGTADGFPIRTSAAPMEGHHWFVFNRAMREATGKSTGDRVKFCVWRDLEERVIETPEDLRHALRGHKAIADFFEKMSFSHRKELIAWIDGAKQAETRTRRVTKAVAALAQRHAERIAKETTEKVKSGEAQAQAKRVATAAGTRAKAIAKDAAGIAMAAAASAAHDYEDRLHKAAVRGAAAIEMGANSAARALRGIVESRQKKRKGGGV